jgi:hypothetical protein
VPNAAAPVGTRRRRRRHCAEPMLDKNESISEQLYPIPRRCTYRGLLWFFFDGVPVLRSPIQSAVVTVESETIFD